MIDIDDCKPNPCLNGGRCTDWINDFKCICKTGFAGKRCEIIGMFLYSSVGYIPLRWNVNHLLAFIYQISWRKIVWEKKQAKVSF